jgi:hypothetical protein
MKIRAGYEISYDCPQPTPMILSLSVHPSRFPDLQTPNLVRLDPPIPANTYHDGFGNFCHVITAPAGRLTVSSDFLIRDSGAPDEIAPEEVQHTLETLPVDASRARRNARSLAVFVRSARARCSYSGVELRLPDSRSFLKRSSAFSLEVISIRSPLF